jgi:hypothetical protein
VRVMSVGCTKVKVEQSANIPRPQYTKCRLCTPPEDEQVMLEICRGPLIRDKLNKKCVTLVSLY